MKKRICKAKTYLNDLYTVCGKPALFYYDWIDYDRAYYCAFHADPIRAGDPEHLMVIPPS